MRPEQLYACRRRNHVHAAFVEAALTIRETLGLDRAIAFLVREGVLQATIERVLISRGPRRHRD
jgi:hypothetical protein